MSPMENKKRPCPICKKPTEWDKNIWKPFCSERCKTRDLGNWATGAYRVPGEHVDPDSIPVNRGEDEISNEDQ